MHRTKDSELPDHIGVELEFMHYLSFLEYNAAQKGEDVNGLRRAQKDFLERHILITMKGISANYKASDETYHALIERTHQFIQNDIEVIESTLQ